MGGEHTPADPVEDDQDRDRAYEEERRVAILALLAGRFPGRLAIGDPAPCDGFGLDSAPTWILRGRADRRPEEVTSGRRPAP